MLDVVTAGDRAVAGVTDMKPDVVIVDALLQGRVSGQQVAEQIRRAEPQVGIITNVGPAHLETLHGLDGVARAKGVYAELRNQILGERLDFPDDTSMRISHEAIYQSLYVQGRGGLNRELTKCLRTGRALREPRARTRRSGKSFVTDDATRIELSDGTRRKAAAFIERGLNDISSDQAVTQNLLKNCVG